MQQPTRFKVRTYAIFIEDQKILVSKEFHHGLDLFKLPGGGVELGESLEEAVLREIEEELSIQAQHVDHAFTFTGFIQNQFNPADQVIGVYFIARADAAALEKINAEQHNPKGGSGELQQRLWLTFDEAVEAMSFDMDRIALAEVIKKARN